MNGTLMSPAGDDASLLAASQTGDVHAFGVLIERYHNLVCAIAYSRTGDRIASEDIAQDTFLAAWRSIHDVREPAKLRAWLCGIARNLASKSLRSRRASDDIGEHEGELAGDAGPLDAMLSKELETTVWAALEQLPETYREPLVLFYREDQSIKQVALGLGLSEETAKQRLSRGRQQLRDNVGDLVEKTLSAGRPRKAAAAAILAAIIASDGAPALASVHGAERTVGRSSRWKLGAASLGVASAIGVGVLALSTTRSEAPRPASRVGSDAIVAELHRARDASKTAGVARTCTLRGSVTHAGQPVAALVAIIENTWQASSLEPVFVDANDATWTARLAAGSYTVSVSAAGHRARSRIVSCSPDRVDNVTFALDRTGAALRGSISDIGGGPIAAATVWLLDLQRPNEPFVTRSAPDGTYELTVDPGLYNALVVHPDYTVEARPITLGPAGVREDLTLLPGGSIEGTVVDARGVPIAGAQVHTVGPTPESLSDAPTRWQMASIVGAVRPVISDANGAFVLHGMAPGSVRLVARSPAYATASPTSVELALAENRTGVVLTAVPARSVSGFVVARGDEKRGLGNVQVVAIADSTVMTMPIIKTTDAAGYFELSGVPAGSYRIAAVGQGFVPHVAEQPLVIGDTDARDVLVALDRGVIVRGTAEPHARVRLAPAGAAMSPTAYVRAAMTRAEVDDAGTFTVTGVAPGAYTITATTFDRRGEVNISVGTSAPPAVRMVLAERPAIAGTVVDASGATLAGVIVSAMPSRARGPLALTHTSVRTDEHGAFRIVGVEAGTHQLRVFDTRGQRAWANEKKRPFKARTVEVAASGATAETLVVAAATARITGIVVGADRKPIADAWIEARARGAHSRPVMFPAAPVLTDAAGRFAIDGLAGSDFLVEATKPDGTQRAIGRAIPSAQLTLELRAPVMVSASVTYDGVPVDTFDVELTHVASDESRRAKGRAGRFTIGAIDGDHLLVVTSDRGYAKRTIALGNGSATDTIALTPWGSLRGRVVGVDGKPLEKASLLLRHSVEPLLAKTDADGRFSIDRVIAGQNELTIIGSRSAPELTAFHFELAPGQHLDAGTIDARTPHSTHASSSADLGLQFFVSVDPPTPAEVAAAAKDPRVAYRGGSDANAVLWVAGVTPNSPAARGGLRTGDRIVGVGMSRVDGGTSAVDMMTSLSTPWRSKGRSVPWAIVRGTNELKLDVLVP
jgi:RNA polymerase sigma factor (sigma-70 family)